MHLVTDPFSGDVLQRALLGCLLVATVCALVGAWVLARGLAFFGDALAHGVLPGVAIASVWGVDLMLGAIVSAIVMIGGVNLVHRTTRLSDDAGIGLLFVGMLAFGVIVLSDDGHHEELTEFLFGDVLGVGTTDLVVGAIVLAVALIGLVLGHRAFLALAVNTEKAAALGLRPGLAHMAMLALLTLAVVGSFQVVGTLLVFGFLVAPPATAVLLRRRVPETMAISVAAAWLAVFVGMIISHHAATPASATVAVVAVTQFFVVLAAVELGSALRHPAPAPA